MKCSFFTLIEMVITVVIIALLASIATPLYFRHVNSSKVTTAKAQIQMFEQAIMTFRLDTGKLPTQGQGLEILITEDKSVKNWKGPYIKGVPLDPWQNEYVYKIPGEHGEFDILSYGADGQPGGEDEDADIGNWILKEKK
jgi:general secretion pathway protein G